MVRIQRKKTVWYGTSLKSVAAVTLVSLPQKGIMDTKVIHATEASLWEYAWLMP